MNRRSRRRAARRARRPSPPRRPLPLVPRLALVVAGAGLIILGVVLAANGTGARGGRVVGALAVVGVLLVAVAWQGKF